MIPVLIIALVLLIGWLIRQSLPEGTEPVNPIRHGLSVAWATFWLGLIDDPDSESAGMPRGPSSPQTCNIMPNSNRSHVRNSEHAPSHDSTEPSDSAYVRTRILRQVQVRDSRGRFTDRWTEIEIDND